MIKSREVSGTNVAACRERWEEYALPCLYCQVPRETHLFHCWCLILQKAKNVRRNLTFPKTRREGPFRQLAVGSRGQATYPGTCSIQLLQICDTRWELLCKIKLKGSLFSSAAGSRMKICVCTQGGGGRWNKENERIFLETTLKSSLPTNRLRWNLLFQFSYYLVLEAFLTPGSSWLVITTRMLLAAWFWVCWSNCRHVRLSTSTLPDCITHRLEG